MQPLSHTGRSVDRKPLLIALAVACTISFECAAASQTRATSLSVIPEQASEITGTASALQLGNAFAAVADAVRPTVVFIRVEAVRRGFQRQEMPRGLRGAVEAVLFPRSVTTSGTGFIVLSDGYIITNQHVIQNARRVFVRLFDGREYEAEIVGEDVMSDIAVLHIDESDLPTAPMGDSEQVRVGEWVLAIGNPMGNSLLFSVTAGIVSETQRSLKVPNPAEQSAQEYIQTDAVANNGNSGGPLVDLHGRIVGMNAAIASRTGYYEGYTLAIPAEVIVPVASQLIRQGHVTRGVFGAVTSKASPEDAVAVGLDTVCGVMVQDAGDEDSPAFRAGLRPGDVIAEVDGHAVGSAAQLQQSVWFKSLGDSVVLSVHREGGVQETVTVHLDTEEIAAPAEEDEDPSDFSDVKVPCSDNPLGICLVEFEDAPALQRFGTKASGPVVTGVYSIGPSFGKIFPDNDIITHVNGKRVRSQRDLEKALRDTRAGDIRSGEDVSLPLAGNRIRPHSPSLRVSRGLAVLR